MTIHNFGKSLKVGKAAESYLDSVFSKWYEISPVSLKQEKRDGIDRIFKCRETKTRWSVEYKTDSRAMGTGNAFIEIVSNDTTGASGWAMKSLAQLLIYYIPQVQLVYVANMNLIKYYLPEWIERYGIASSKNETYTTFGILVPLDILNGISIDVLNIRHDGFFDRLKRDSGQRPPRKPMRKIADALKMHNGTNLKNEIAELINRAKSR